ncbi:hypothetical protein PybrP1_000344 [[Pythium] brassicae (nom. inval.)]|nr:hypothetical protein PybrP1_000344 [[Pythium] brassicae (nom. inval.)]
MGPKRKRAELVEPPPDAESTVHVTAEQQAAEAATAAAAAPAESDPQLDTYTNGHKSDDEVHETKESRLLNEEVAVAGETHQRGCEEEANETKEEGKEEEDDDVLVVLELADFKNHPIFDECTSMRIEGIDTATPVLHIGEYSLFGQLEETVGTSFFYDTAKKDGQYQYTGQTTKRIKFTIAPHSES